MLGTSQIKYIKCQRCDAEVRFTGIVECNSNYPNKTWDGQCERCGWRLGDDRRDEEFSEQADDEFFMTHYGRV